MARYDNDNQHQRRNRPDDRELSRRRDPRDDDEWQDDRRSPRRESLMQRRLRAARGESVDDPDDEADEPDDYPRMRPVYRSSSGGGCAATTLYVVLGIAAVTAIVLLALPQILSNTVGNVPQQIVQVIASPTPTIRDRGGTIQQIRSLNRLETQSFAVERVIDAGVQGNAFQNLLFGDRLLLIASGSVVAGVDLSQLTADDVTISPDGESITLRLPPSQIFQATLDNSRTRVYDRQQGLLAPQNKDLESQARQAAEQEILKAACEGGIMQKAADEARRSMEQFLGLLDFTSVTVTASAGPCTATPTVPLLPTAPTAP